MSDRIRQDGYSYASPNFQVLSLKKFIANGSDHFQALLDRQMKNNGSKGNVGRLVLQIQGPALKNLISQRLQNNISREIYGLRYVFRWFTSSPFWKTTGSDHACPLIELTISGDDFINELPLPDIDIKKTGLYGVHLIQHKTAFYFLFSWHHILFDARGAEAFARFLCGEMDSLKAEDCFPEIKKLPLLQLFKDAKTAKDFIFSEKGLIVNSLAKKKRASTAAVKYLLLEFDEGQTEQIQARASKMVRLAKSPFYLACCAMSVKSLLDRRGIPFKSLFMPVPQDQRLRGSVKPIMSNQISYLFFRLLPKDFTTLEKSTKLLAQQMMNQIRGKIPSKYASMMSLFKRTPLWFNNFIMKGPTKGVFASFFFSDTGVSFDKLNVAREVKILDAIHLPPANTYPGFTIVFSMFQQKLKLSICYTDDACSQEEIRHFESTLCNLLMKHDSEKSTL